jgi:hypothetical protein
MAVSAEARVEVFWEAGADSRIPIPASGLRIPLAGFGRMQFAQTDGRS